MRKIIDNKRFDTETARLVGERANGEYVSDLGYTCESLYRKRNGEFFLHCQGGPASRYAEARGNGEWVGGESIEPLTYEAARAWAGDNLGADEFEAAFGPASEGDGPVAVTVRVSPAAKAALERESSRTGCTASAVVDGLLLSLGA